RRRSQIHRRGYTEGSRAVFGRGEKVCVPRRTQEKRVVASGERGVLFQRRVLCPESSPRVSRHMRDCSRSPRNRATFTLFRNKERDFSSFLLLAVSIPVS